MENLVVLGVSGVIAIGLFFFVFFHGKKENIMGKWNFEEETISFFGIIVSFVVVAYIVRLVVMVITGLGAGLNDLIIVTGGIALLPLVFLSLIDHLGRRRG
jgi:hypothetical protein